MNTLADQHAGMDDTMLAVRLTPEQASRLVEFANQHDGGPMPRAGYNEARDAVVVRSLVVNPVGPVSYEYDEVRSMRALRELLGY
jgi:hypothetical protein